MRTKIQEAMTRLGASHPTIRGPLSVAARWLHGIEHAADVIPAGDSVLVRFRDADQWVVLAFGTGGRFLAMASLPMGGDQASKILHIRDKFDAGRPPRITDF